MSFDEYEYFVECLIGARSLPSWLHYRLHERSWNKHDVSRQCGPDHKTVQKILDGLPVREDVLEKLAKALSQKKATVETADIPKTEPPKLSHSLPWEIPLSPSIAP
jgi:hypothetical protein